MKLAESIDALNKLMGKDGDPILKGLIRTSAVTKYATLMLDEIEAIEDIELKYQSVLVVSGQLDKIRDVILKQVEEYNKTKKDDHKDVKEPKAKEAKINDKLTSVKVIEETPEGDSDDS